MYRQSEPASEADFSKRKGEKGRLRTEAHSIRVCCYNEHIRTTVNECLHRTHEFHIHIRKFVGDNNIMPSAFSVNAHIQTEARAQTTNRMELEEQREEWICVCMCVCVREAQNIRFCCYILYVDRLSVYRSSVASCFLQTVTASNVASGPTSQSPIQPATIMVTKRFAHVHGRNLCSTAFWRIGIGDDADLFIVMLKQ